MATITAFPTPDLTGILYSRYYEPEPDYDAVVFENTYDDKGIATNTVSLVPIYMWEIEFNGLTPAEAQIWDEHYDLAFGIHNDFSFTDKAGNTHTGVRYMRDGYKRSHDAHKSWIQNRKIKLIKRVS